MIKPTREAKTRKFMENLWKEEEIHKKREILKEAIKGYKTYKFRITDLEILKEMNELNNIDNTGIDQLIKLDQDKIHKIDEMLEYLKNNNTKQYRAIYNVLIEKKYQAECARNESLSDGAIKYRVKMGLENIINNFDI